MKLKVKHKGFTVLEFLVVVAIMSILVGLILVGLNAARSNARDQEKIANLQKIALGIEQYRDICREYPADLIPDQRCDNLNGSTLENLIPDIATYGFEDTTSEYGYMPIDDDYGNGPNTCSSYHVWVRLEKDRETNAARFDSTNAQQCFSTYGRYVNAFADHTIYDIYK